MENPNHFFFSITQTGNKLNLTSSLTGCLSIAGKVPELTTVSQNCALVLSAFFCISCRCRRCQGWLAQRLLKQLWMVPPCIGGTRPWDHTIPYHPHHSLLPFLRTPQYMGWRGWLVLHKAFNLWNLYCLAQAHLLLILTSTWYIRKNREKLLPGKYTAKVTLTS